jgi:hypothetical protein
MEAMGASSYNLLCHIFCFLLFPELFVRLDAKFHFFCSPEMPDSPSSVRAATCV